MASIVASGSVKTIAPPPVNNPKAEDSAAAKGETPKLTKSQKKRMRKVQQKKKYKHDKGAKKAVETPSTTAPSSSKGKQG
jgi:hypothetical protein